MEIKIKKILVIMIFICITIGIKPYDALAAPKKYVRTLTVSKKTVSINVGQSKKVSYEVKVKGKASKKIKVKASNNKIKVKIKSGKIVISAKKAGTSKITITTKGKNKKGKKIKKYIKVKSVKKPESIKEPDPVVTPPIVVPPIEVTKSEWISSIMNATGYSVQKELFDCDENGNISYSFDDIESDINVDIIETAVRYGIIPSGDRNFQPNDAADREFAAVTAVRALGFAASEIDLACSDEGDLNYPAEDTLAVKLKLLELSNGKFVPKKAVTKAEKQNVENILAGIIKNREIDKEHKDVIEYREDVKIEEDVTDYEISEQNGIYTVTVSVGTSLDEVKAGDKILLPMTEKYTEGIALCVSSNVLSLDTGKRMITGTMPEDIEEFVDAMDIEGMAQADTATAVEGVATVEVTKGDAGKSLKRASVNGEIDLKDKTKFTYTIKMIETTLSFYLSELKYKVDFNRKGVKELYIGLPNVVELDTLYEAKQDFSKKIGDIPVKLGGGLSVNIEVYLEAEIGGKIHMNFKLSNEVGVQYCNGELLQIKRCIPNLDVTGEADADVGAKLQVGLYWMEGIKKVFGKSDPRPLYNAYTKWGFHGNALLKLRNDKYTSFENLLCVELSYYLYGNVKVGDGSFLGEKFDLKKTWDIFDEKNSPLKGKLHMENGRIVLACTYQSPNVLFAKYIEQLEFLCDDTEIRDGYVCYDSNKFKWKSDIERNPFSYDIADFDSDGDNELLIADVKYFDGLDHGDSIINLQMYEVRNGNVQLEAEKMCEATYWHIPAYETTDAGSTNLFKYIQNGEWIIALENRVVGMLASGRGVQFMAVKYDGKSFVNVGEYWYLGSDFWIEEINDLKNKLTEMNINADAEEIFGGNKYIIDYIETPVIIGQSSTKIIADSNFCDEAISSPREWMGFSQISFACN